MRSIDLSGLNLDATNATPCVSAAQKFVIPVPKASSGDPLVYPAGWTIKGVDVGGKPITDWQGNPLAGERLLVVNAVDRCLQTPLVSGDGVLIVNQASGEQATKLFAWVDARGGDPAMLTPDQMREFVQYASALGLSDVYDSDRSFIRTKMTPVTTDGRSSNDAGYGWLKRDDRVVCHAVRIDEPFELKAGPTATPQQFDAGSFIVQVEGKRHGVRADKFLETYLRPDRTPFGGASEIKAM